MPDYDFRCEGCGRHLTLYWRSIAQYAAAAPVCPHCQGHELTRLISAVGVARPSHDYRSMSSEQMLSVLEDENPRAVQELQRQVHESADEG